MTLDQRLLDVLVCPRDHQPLHYLPGEHTLYNPRLRLRYRIVDDIPVMLVDQAETVDDAEHDRLMALAEAAPGA
jgi:uncharacterized protein